MIITIDGPAGAGKSTLSIELAKKLNFFCLNSGYIYRAVAYVLQHYFNYTEEKLYSIVRADLEECIHKDRLRYTYKEGIVELFWNNINITFFLKESSVGQAAAIVGQNKNVRELIYKYKHQLVADKDAVVEGRVTGSIIFPQADLKLYVTASEDVRAQRFVRDQAKRGVTYTQQEALSLIHERDIKDMTRGQGTLIIPQDAVIIDTSELSQGQALQKALDLVHDRMNKNK